jgi:hypothetical protein
VSNKTWISLFILLVLGLHAVPVLSYQGVRQTRWPFLAWAMYAKSYPPGPITATMRKIVGTSAGGKREEITPKLVGLSGAAFRNAYGVPLWKGDSAAARELMDRINRGRRDPVRELRLESIEYRLGNHGVVVDTAPARTFSAFPKR